MLGRTKPKKQKAHHQSLSWQWAYGSRDSNLRRCLHGGTSPAEVTTHGHAAHHNSLANSLLRIGYLRLRVHLNHPLWKLIAPN
jgi:hypothetical protein